MIEPGPGERVLRIYHSAVVTAYRQRDRELRMLGVTLTLATARRWNEGGNVVDLHEGEDHFVVPLRTLGHHPFLFLYSPIGLWHVLRKQKFDLIDAHEEPASLAALEAMVFRCLLQPASKLMFYSAENLPKRYPMPFRWIERHALKSASAIHCCNQAAVDNLRRKGFKGRLIVLGLGVDTRRFAPTSRRPNTGPLRVGYVGRLEDRKGIWVLLAAAIAVPAVTLEFFGDGPERVSLRERIRFLGLDERIHVRGFAAHEDLPDLFQSLDVLCVPSLPTRTWIEQFGRVAIEAMASGVPVVASRVGSLPEVVNGAGILLPPGDTGALANTLRLLADGPDLRASMAEQGQERAREYSWESIAKAHHRVYVEVLA